MWRCAIVHRHIWRKSNLPPTGYLFYGYILVCKLKISQYDFYDCHFIDYSEDFAADCYIWWFSAALGVHGWRCGHWTVCVYHCRSTGSGGFYHWFYQLGTGCASEIFLDQVARRALWQPRGQRLRLRHHLFPHPLLCRSGEVGSEDCGGLRNEFRIQNSIPTWLRRLYFQKLTANLKTRRRARGTISY